MLVHFQLFAPHYKADSVAATPRRYRGIQARSHLLPDEHQRHLFMTETFHLHIRFRDCSTQSIFVTEKNVFQIKFVSKTKEFTSQSLPGSREDNIPSSALRKLKLPDCWEVLRSLSLFLMPTPKGAKCLHLTLPPENGKGAEHHTSKPMQRVYFVSSEPETLQTTNICSSKLFPL